MPAATLTTGDRISEYVLVETIGEGSFGTVWKAHHHVWEDQFVAVKVARDSALARSLASEGAVIHGLKHDRIVRALGMDPYGDPPYLIMEFVDGSDLRKFIASHGPLHPSMAVSVLRDIVEALAFAHEAGVIHRDIKPANVLLDTTQSPMVAKLTDFGLGVQQASDGSILRSTQATAADAVAGTIAYMAPEVQHGQRADARSDLYSVGLVLFEMLTGQLPVGGERIGDFRDDVPSWMDDLFGRLNARRERRLGSAVEILQIIRDHNYEIPTGSATAATGQAPRCQSCNAVGRAGDNFCMMCGEQLVAEVRRCPRCEGYPAAEDQYCMFCGCELPAAVV